MLGLIWMSLGTLASVGDDRALAATLAGIGFLWVVTAKLIDRPPRPPGQP